MRSPTWTSFEGGISVQHCFENIGWTVGNHCNATCGHCYSWKVRKDSAEFLTHRDVDRVVAQLRSFGIKTVNLGGNEPIYTHGPELHSTILPYIIQKLTDAAIPVGLTTNGITFTYLDKHHPETLRLLNDIDFSLDSPFEAEHDKNRGNRLHRVVLQAVQRALELGIDCSVIACGMRANFTPEHLSSFLMLTKLLGCEFRINTLKPLEPSLLPEMPSAQQFYEGFAFLMNNTHCVTLGESCLTAFTETGTRGCPCGTSSFRINAKTRDGRIPINPCVYAHEFRSGDLLTEDLAGIVQSPAFRSFAERRQHLPRACREADCTYAETCRGGCTARSFFVHRSLDEKDPYCPQEYQAKHGIPALPIRPDIGCRHGFRVHDNYLCTWIGEVHSVFDDQRFPTLEAFLLPREIPAIPLSGHRQSSDDPNVSLVQLRRVEKR